MASIRSICLHFSVILLLSGCTHYDVRVNGYMETSKRSDVKPDASVTVIDDVKAVNSIQEKEVKTKIEKLLKEKGYKKGTIQDSDYYLLFGYGIGKGRTVSGSLPLYQPGGTATVTSFGTYGSSTSTVQLPGTTTFIPYSETVYSRWLLLKLIDGKHYRETNEAIDVWVGDVTSTGSNSDIREVIDYLLISAFDHFCENTGKQVKETIMDGDERVKNLAISQ